MDTIATADPPLAHSALPAESSPNDASITPLDLMEGPKVRTKLRLYAILIALYVIYIPP